MLFGFLKNLRSFYFELLYYGGLVNNYAVQIF